MARHVLSPDRDTVDARILVVVPDGLACQSEVHVHGLEAIPKIHLILSGQDITLWGNTTGPLRSDSQGEGLGLGAHSSCPLLLLSLLPSLPLDAGSMGPQTVGWRCFQSSSLQQAELGDSSWNQGWDLL